MFVGAQVRFSGFSFFVHQFFQRNLIMTKTKKQIRKGQALVEYTVILAAVMLVSLGTISLLGHKTTDMLGTLTAILPGAHPGDNGPVSAGELIPTSTNAAGALTVDTSSTDGVMQQDYLLDDQLFDQTGTSPLVIETANN
jgi:pilus assembly protein Flp/PilA